MKLKTVLVIGLVIVLLAPSVANAISIKFGTDPFGVVWFGNKLPELPNSYDFIVGVDYDGVTYYAVNASNNFVQYTGLVLHTVVNDVIDELETRSNNVGGKILLKSGKYALVGTINLKPNICIEGTGMERTLQKNPTTISWIGVAGLNGFFYDGSVGDGFILRNFELRSYYVTMNSWVCSLGAGELSTVDNVDFMGGDIEGHGGFYNYSIYYEGMDTGIIKNCDIYGALIEGIHLGTQHLPTFHSCNTVIVDNCYIRANHEGIFIGEGSFKNVIQNCKFEYNHVYSINISKNMSQTLRYGAVETSILNCYFENQYKNASIFLYASQHTSIRDCYSLGNLTRTGVIFPNATKISNCYVLTPGVSSSYLDYPLSISGNYTVIEGTTCNGIQVDHGDYGVVRDVVVVGGARHYSFSYINQGIVIENGCSYWKVEDCRVENVNTTGISNCGDGGVISGCTVNNVCNNPAYKYAIYGTIVRDTFVDGSGSFGCSISGAITNSLGFSYPVNESGLQSAIYDLNSSNRTTKTTRNGGWVELPSCNITITSTIRVIQSSITIRGAGNSTILYFAPHAVAALKTNMMNISEKSGTYHIANIIVEGIQFDVNNASQANDSTCAIYFGLNVDNCTIRDCTFIRGKYSFIGCSESGTVKYITIENNYFDGREHHGYGGAISLRGYYYIIRNNIIKDTYATGITLESGYHGWSIIDGNIIFGNIAVGIYANEYTGCMQIINNRIMDINSTAYASSAKVGISVLNNNTVSNNYIYKARTCGIGGGANNTISNNIILETVTDASDAACINVNEFNILSGNLIENNFVGTIATPRPTYGIRMKEYSTAIGNIIYARGVAKFNYGIDLRSNYGKAIGNTIANALVPVRITGSFCIVRDNIGYTTESWGNVTLLSGTYSINVTHNLSATPTWVFLEPMSNMSTSGGYSLTWYVSARGATTFRITLSTRAPANKVFNWYAKSV